MLVSTELTVKNHNLNWGKRTYVMGILNITPDSFSGDGFIKSNERNYSIFIAQAVEQGRRFMEAGVDILDIGGESTRPGSQPVSADEESERVIPVIDRLASEFDVLISIDTYKASVAEAALNSGAHIVNDIWSLHADPDLAATAARYNAPVILMHNRSKPSNAQI